MVLLKGRVYDHELMGLNLITRYEKFRGICSIIIPTAVVLSRRQVPVEN